ncbi:MAG: hypothetical protein JXM70_23430 [Pirellulales bacterium]|nr:hypothetical protein [Pirellulales bacterium]
MSSNRILVFASHDRGKSWSRLADLKGQWWSTLFVHRDQLYIMGTSGLWGHVVIRRSKDGGKTWKLNSIILQHPDRKNTAFQYVDWQFEGDDIIFVSRTAYGESHNFHDANYFTFHRLSGFRTRNMDDPPLKAELR